MQKRGTIITSPGVFVKKTGFRIMPFSKRVQEREVKGKR
jgi:hypothetical protein